MLTKIWLIVIGNTGVFLNLVEIYKPRCHHQNKPFWNYSGKVPETWKDTKKINFALDKLTVNILVYLDYGFRSTHMYFKIWNKLTNKDFVIYKLLKFISNFISSSSIAIYKITNVGGCFCFTFYYTQVPILIKKKCFSKSKYNPKKISFVESILLCWTITVDLPCGNISAKDLRAVFWLNSKCNYLERAWLFEQFTEQKRRRSRGFPCQLLAKIRWFVDTSTLSKL